MTESYSGAVETARAYYNSDDADTFYYTVWGGEDIHIGTYASDDESIFDASRRTVTTMASMIAGAFTDMRVLDIGSGYGGSARYLAETFRCRVTALNLSDVENRWHRQMNEQQGLDHLIEVVDGNFENIPFADGSFNVVWSQDAILHSGDREKVLAEVCRVLKSGGQFIFTDPMQADDCPDGVLQPILDRIHLETLGCPRFYRETLARLGMKEHGFLEMDAQLPLHYNRVLQETRSREDELAVSVSRDYIERMKKGLRYWVDGGNSGYLSWGIFHFSKP